MTAPPPSLSEREDLLVVALRLLIDRARGVLAAREVDGGGASYIATARDQLAEIEGVVFQKTVPTRREGWVPLSGLVRDELDGRDPELAAVLAHVSYLYRRLEVPRSLSVLDSPGAWGKDQPSPVSNPDTAAAGRLLAYRLALAHAELAGRLRSAVPDQPVRPDEAAAHQDGAWSFVLLSDVHSKTSRMRRAVRLALHDDPSELLLMAKAYREYRSSIALTYGERWVAHAEGSFLGGTPGRLAATATGADAVLDTVSLVFGRPEPPPPPPARTVEAALYRLALSHSDLRGTTVGVHAAPWPSVQAAFDAAAGQIDAAVLDALDDPSPRYGAGRRLGHQWLTYGETISRLPLDTLGGEGRAAVLARAEEVARDARSVVDAVAALADG